MKRLIALATLLLIATLIVGCGHNQANVAKQKHHVISSRAVDTALQMVGTRYVYGGKSPGKGFDCSGLVYYSYRHSGLAVPRSTRQQLRATKSISRNRVKQGDLLFFNQLGKRSSHVGIYVGNDKFVHAPSSGKSVRVDNLNKRYWKKHLASIRRFYY